MGIFEMVVAIVVVVCITGMVSEWLKYRRQQQRARTSPGLEDEVRQLRRRVEALEAIVTDGREDLRRRFQDLEQG